MLKFTNRSPVCFNHELQVIANEFQEFAMNNLDKQNVTLTKSDRLDKPRYVKVESDEYKLVCIVTKK